MARLVTEKYDSKDLFENLYKNFDNVTTHSLSKLLVYITPGKYRFLVSEKSNCFGIRYITYNSGQRKVLPLVEGTLFLEKFKYLTFEIKNDVQCNLMVIPIQYIIQMQANATYIITVNEVGEVSHVRNESEEDYDEEKEEYIFLNN